MHASGTEEWMKPVCEGVCEGVNVDTGFCAEEGYTALCVVQEHAHLPGPVFYSQQGDRRGVGHVLASSLHAYSPETICGADGELALPVYGLSDDTQVPLDLLPDLHLPEAPPTAEALFA